MIVSPFAPLYNKEGVAYTNSGPRPKRESIDSVTNDAVDGFFFVENQSTHPVCV